VALVFAAPTASVAGAFVSSTTGQVVRWTTAPPSLQLDAQQDPVSAIAFNEAQDKRLVKPVAVDAVAPGKYKRFAIGADTIPAGTVVDSHLIHSDPTGKKARRSGSVRFPGPIVGVIGASSRLAASDAALGAPGTRYPSTHQRGLEVPDKVTISKDRRTVTFVLRTTVIDEFRVLTAHAEPLTISITDSPDPVTAGNAIQYSITVANISPTPVPNVRVVDMLPAGTTFVTALAPGGCTGTGPVTCTLGTMQPGASARARVVVTSPPTVPAGGTITDTAMTAPGGVTASQKTAVEPLRPGVAKGFVLPGNSIATSGANPATLSLPDTGSGAPVIMTQGTGTFCGGPCRGPATTISEFGGYSDPNHPIRLTLTYSFPDAPDSLLQAVVAFGSTIYKNVDPQHPSVGATVPWCNILGGGVAVPHPCVNQRAIVQPSPNSFLVGFEILYISGDPKFARR
jgi:uncharacterized repeat protein (TIGR01451 family)